MNPSVSLRTQIDHDLRGVGRPVLVGSGDLLAGRYLIKGELGRGGVAQVFRAYDQATRTSVALKIVRSDLAGRRSALDRLGLEVRHARAVQHPNVCRVFELHESNCLTFLTMELAQGSLRDDLQAGAPRAIADRMRDARAVTAGLAAIHQAGILHRDLKPENLLRMADGRLVVSDFGLARQRGTRSISERGTPGYLAPEIQQGLPSSPRSDIWSLGVVLHEIFFGGRPGPDSSRTRTEAALAELCMACMDARPAGRPRTAVAVLARLDGLDGEARPEWLRRPANRAPFTRAAARSVPGIAPGRASGRGRGGGSETLVATRERRSTGNTPPAAPARGSGGLSLLPSILRKPGYSCGPELAEPARRTLLHAASRREKPMTNNHRRPKVIPVTVRLALSALGVAPTACSRADQEHGWEGAQGNYSPKGSTERRR
jgi:serine/threonine protein kinase